MAETNVKPMKARAWVAGIVALACIQAWLSGAAHAYCLDPFSAIFSPVELEIIVPIVGLCVAAYVGVTISIASMRLLHWRTVAVLVVIYVIAASAAVVTLTPVNLSRMWPVVGSAIAIVAIGLTVRRIPPLAAAILGLSAAAACFAITYAITPFTHSGNCGFAP